MSYYDYDDYDRYDAMADAAHDKWMELLQPRLDELVQPVMDAVEITDEEMPHPWTWERHLLQIWLDDGDDACREVLEEHFREEAEELANEDARNGPCCNDFHCPCGNTNNYRG